MPIVMWFFTYFQVRAAGLGLAVTLTSTLEGRLLVNSNCKHIPGGIWGAAFSILLDQSECSIVRQQVRTTIFRAFLSSACLFQNQLFRKILEYHQCVNQFGSRSGQTCFLKQVHFTT